MKKTVQFPKIGLALGGGAARGFCHIGIIKALEEHQIPIHCISGCSIGAIVGGCYASGADVKDMEKMARKVRSSILVDFDILQKKDGLFKGNRAMAIVKQFVGAKTFEECKIPFAATVTEIRKGELRILKSGRISDAIHASMSIPGIFGYFKADDGERFVDGGVMERIPVTAARELGAEFVIAVDCLGPPRVRDTLSGIFDSIEQTYLLMDWAANKERILNEPDFLITPDQGNRSMYKFSDNEGSIKSGEAAAHEAIPEILNRLKKFKTPKSQKTHTNSSGSES